MRPQFFQPDPWESQVYDAPAKYASILVTVFVLLISKTVVDLLLDKKDPDTRNKSNLLNTNILFSLHKSSNVPVNVPAYELLAPLFLLDQKSPHQKTSSVHLLGTADTFPIQILLETGTPGRSDSISPAEAVSEIFLISSLSPKCGHQYFQNIDALLYDPNEHESLQQRLEALSINLSLF